MNDAIMLDRKETSPDSDHPWIRTPQKRVGIVGVGEQGWNNILPSLANISEVDIVGICDLDPERRSRAARSYGANAYDNFGSMADCELIDVVVVASHPKVHADVLREAIPRGIPVFIEKPPTLSTHELTSLIQLNQTYGTPTAVGLNFSFTEPVRLLKEALSSPTMGHIEYVRVTHFNNKPTDTLWGQNEMRSFLLSQVIHPLGVLYDLGRSTDLNPSIHCVTNREGIVLNVHMNMEDRTTKHPFTTDLVATSSSPFFNWSMQVVTSTGAVINITSLHEMEIYAPSDGNGVIKNPKWWRQTWQPSPLSGGFKRNGYQSQLEHFFNRLDSKLIASNSLESMLPLYELMDQVEERSCHDENA